MFHNVANRRDGRKIGTVFEVKKEIPVLSPYKYLRREDALFMECFSGGRMAMEIGVNMEFIRSEDKPFEEGVERAAKLGYKWVEPMVHNGRELLSELSRWTTIRWR